MGSCVHAPGRYFRGCRKKDKLSSDSYPLGNKSLYPWLKSASVCIFNDRLHPAEAPSCKSFLHAYSGICLVRYAHESLSQSRSNIGHIPGSACRVKGHCFVFSGLQLSGEVLLSLSSITSCGIISCRCGGRPEPTM